MSFTVEQKSQLAKLMATENLRIEHQKIRTAKFDPTNRVLYLPIWRNMTGTIYDLLCGHEVGHALYTPAEGWHDVVTDKTKPKAYKHFLNVVEDARIEKKVKRKYPGLKSSFTKAYNELMDRDFFGIKDRSVNDLPFIDRLNLYTKSQYTATWINFTTEEESMVRKVENLETWEDVLRITNEVYEYSKEEQYEMEESQDFYSFDEEILADEFDDYDYEEDGDNDKENENGNSPKSEGESEGLTEEDTEDTDTDSGSQINRFKDSVASEKDSFVPKCETDEAFRQNEDQLLDEKCKPYVYVDIPKPNYKRIITNAKRVHEQLNSFYLKSYTDGGVSFRSRVSSEDAKAWTTEFKNKNDRYIGLLAKEFEMRKAAKAFSKSKLCDTGDIDIAKLSSYKFDDNIFRKVMLTPKGKNHGLVLLLDKSGSMSNNMAGSIEQILVLSMFCRKVNIPFIVYGFGDSIEANACDVNLSYDEFKKLGYDCFSTNEGELSLGTVFLREYLNSKMTNSEFSQAVRNLIILKKSFESGRWGIRRPESEDLSNTPLIQAIFASAGIMNEFRKRYNLDLTSLVIVHDGDSDSCSTYNKMVERHDYLSGVTKQQISRYSFSYKSENVILRDSKNKFEKRIEECEQDAVLNVALDWFKKVTNSKVFGFFLTGSGPRDIKSSLYSRYVFEDGKSLHTIYNQHRKIGNLSAFEELRTSLMKKMKSEKFLVSNTPGYDSFYLIVGGNELQTVEEELEVEGKVTSGKLKNAFMKMNKRKAINRVLVSKFIQGIAA